MLLLRNGKVDSFGRRPPVVLVIGSVVTSDLLLPHDRAVSPAVGGIESNCVRVQIRTRATTLEAHVCAPSPLGTAAGLDHPVVQVVSLAVLAVCRNLMLLCQWRIEMMRVQITLGFDVLQADLYAFMNIRYASVCTRVNDACHSLGSDRLAVQNWHALRAVAAVSALHHPQTVRVIHGIHCGHRLLVRAAAPFYFVRVQPVPLRSGRSAPWHTGKKHRMRFIKNGIPLTHAEVLWPSRR